MIRLKNLAYRFFILFAGAGLLISLSNCASDEKDKDFLLDQTFLEKYDNTKWTIIQDEMRIYLRFNNDMEKAIEMWMSELEIAKLIASEECFYYTAELMDTEEVEILENSELKLEFTYLGNETWTFSMEGERLKLVFKTLNSTRDPVYFNKTSENFNDLKICPDESSRNAFDWKLLK